MEDYELAHECRLKDIEALLAAPQKRITAATHLGGVAVECRLKALLISYHRIADWDDLSRRPKDPKLGQPINRTGHSLVSAIRMMPDFYKKAKADPAFLRHLNNLTYPTGASSNDFISLRYSASELNLAMLSGWQISLNYVLGWLKKNEEFV